MLKPFWQDDINFYSANWWRELWEQSARVEVKKCFSLACHQEAWDDWLQCDNPYARGDVDMIKAENGLYFDTIGIIAGVL